MKLKHLESISDLFAWIAGILVSFGVIYKTFKAMQAYFESKRKRNEAITNVVEDNAKYRDLIYNMHVQNEAQTKALSQLTIDMGFVKAATMISAEKNNLMWWRSDAEGLTIQISPQTCKFFKLSEQELMGRNWFNHVPKSEHARLAAAFDTSKRYKSDFDETFPIIKGDKTWCLVRAFAKFAGEDWFGIHEVIEDNIQQAA